MLILNDETHTDRNAVRKGRSYGAAREYEGLHGKRWFQDNIFFILIAVTDIKRIIEKLCKTWDRKVISQERDTRG